MEIFLSASAAKRIAEILASNPDKKALRISVEGGGCSGFSYKYELVEQETPNADDFMIEKNGARVFIDTVSLPFMDKAEIDFEDKLMGKSFVIHNPNAIASCGCGTSFSV